MVSEYKEKADSGEGLAGDCWGDNIVLAVEAWQRGPTILFRFCIQCALPGSRV